VSGHLHCKSGDDGDQVGGDGDSSVCVASQHLLEHVPQVQGAVVRPCLHQLTLHFQPSQFTALLIMTIMITIIIIIILMIIVIIIMITIMITITIIITITMMVMMMVMMVLIIISIIAIIRYGFRLLLFSCISR